MRFLLLQSFATAIAALAVKQPSKMTPGAVSADLSRVISAASKAGVELRARWSLVGAPSPAVVVSVTTESDVASVVKYCTEKRVPFVAQNGGNGWATTFNLGETGVLINMAGLNAITFNQDKTQATIGGGAVIGDVIPAANAAGALVITGNCNCVGAVSAMLGGGYGNIMGEVGFGVDNIVSMRVVLASGEIVTVSPTSNPDLFWAMRGAGPNFGIVISVTIKSQPATEQDRTAYINNLFFSPDQIETVAQTMQDLPLTPEQRVYLVLTSSGPPLNEPSILITGFLRKGTEEEGRKAFAPFYELGPVSASSAVTQYLDWNDSNDGFCARGDRKPAYSTTINNMQAQKWPEIWELYKGFQAKGPNSAVLIERYNLTKANAAPTGSAAMNEKLRTEAFAQAIVIPWYTDAALDGEAETFASEVRALWSYNADAKKNPAYINFAHGDETLEAIYGSSLPRLKTLKKQYDPTGAFNQWFTIET
ncbi:hypothetical protein HBH70_071530 [Parastagonospora nodorum]|nr:hypothetical protein HBH53_100760 [Parastagonospora nodorum]KAH4220660.1 hypothetical protein HBI06_166450 [Parastagonospora nodorum]KAH4237263.1 hypothetical protein HBI05_128870 [Parastagonospora nodorum]KAH5143066.1 hypothetical protein HBH70_071530 [Parastagonospora nodorum]KAH5185642.1 hypothetical protein HBH76_126040 [Parastagonospora nodorum]